MTGAPEADNASRTPHDGTDVPEDDAFSRLGEEERRVLLKWVGENLSDVRGIASGKRVQQWILWLSLVIGLLVYVAGYALRASSRSEPLAFFGDLLYALGYALWTGVVVVVFLQIIPEVKRRQYKQVLDAYERARRAGARADARQGSSDDGGPSSSQQQRG
jgi:hypothetical protein